MVGEQRSCTMVVTDAAAAAPPPVRTSIHTGRPILTTDARLTPLGDARRAAMNHGDHASDGDLFLHHSKPQEALGHDAALKSQANLERLLQQQLKVRGFLECRSNHSTCAHSRTPGRAHQNSHSRASGEQRAAPFLSRERRRAPREDARLPRVERSRRNDTPSLQRPPIRRDEPSTQAVEAAAAASARKAKTAKAAKAFSLGGRGRLDTATTSSTGGKGAGAKTTPTKQPQRKPKPSKQPGEPAPYVFVSGVAVPRRKVRVATDQS